MNKLTFLAFFFGLIACKKTNKDASPIYDIKSPAAYILSDQKIYVLDLVNNSLTDSFSIGINNAVFANQISNNLDLKTVSFSLPHFDFSLDHSALHTVSPLGGIGIYDLTERKLTSQLSVPFANYNAVLNNNEIWTMAYSHSGKVYVYDKNTGNKISEIIVDADPTDIIMAQNGASAVFVAGESSFLTTINTKTKKTDLQIKIDPYPNYVRKGMDENTIFVENQDRKSLNIVNLTKNKTTDFIDFSFIPRFSIYKADSNQIWVAAKDQTIIAKYQFQVGNWLKTDEINTSLGIVQFSFYKNQIIAVNQLNKNIEIYDMKSKRLTNKFHLDNKPNSLIIWTN